MGPRRDQQRHRAATIRAVLEGVDVLGIRDGFEWIMKGDNSARRVPRAYKETSLPFCGETVTALHQGGCACGAVRYRVQGEPEICQICHCRYCQRRLGSAFATIAYFDDRNVTFLRGDLTEYEHRSDETGRWLRMQFCPRCGTTVTHTVEIRPGLRAIAVGTLDDPEWPRIQRHIWGQSRRSWVAIPPGMVVFPQAAPGSAK